MSVNFLDFAEIVIRRCALDLAAGAASTAFSWDDFPRMAVSYVKLQWVVTQGQSAEDVERHSVELTVLAEAVARDHFKAHVAQPGILVYESADLPGQWVAHDLLTDTVTQGNSRSHAISMLGEALALRAGGATGNPWLDASGRSKDDPQWAEYQEEIRRQSDNAETP